MRYWHFLFSITDFVWVVYYAYYMISEKKSRYKSRNIIPMVPKQTDDGNDEREKSYPPAGFGIATIVNLIAILGFAWFDSIGI